MINSKLAFEIISGVTALTPCVFKELANGYTAPIFIGLGCFSLASLTDRCFRYNFLQKLPLKQVSYNLGIESAIWNELIYSVFLLQPHTFSNPWAATVFTIGRNFSTFIVGADAAKSLCDYFQYPIDPSSGFPIDSKIGFIWMVLREGIIRTLPQGPYFPFLMLTNSVIYGLDESSTIKDDLANRRKVWQYTLCSAVAFRLIANIGLYYGGIAAPLTQHILFNISSYLLPRIYRPVPI